MDEQTNAQGQDNLLNLDELMQRFGVAEWRNLGPVASLQPQVLHVLVEIEGQRYILRERSEGLVNEDANFRYAFRSFLQQADIPIPALWRSTTGEPCVTIGEDAFELEQVVDGEQYNTTDRHSLQWVAAAATMLGQIHQASRRYRGPQHRWPSEAHIGGVVQGYLNLARSKAEQSEIAAIAAALSNWCDQWEAVLPSAMVAIGSVRGLPEFHIHGDYHALNLRFGLKGVNAVLNWEAARWEKRIIELAYALYYFSALAWQPESTIAHPLVKRGLDPERVHSFLEAYRAIYPLEEGEAAILGDALLLIAPIATINGPLEDLFFAPHGLDESLIDEVMERLAWAISLPGWLLRVRRSLF